MKIRFEEIDLRSLIADIKDRLSDDCGDDKDQVPAQKDNDLEDSGTIPSVDPSVPDLGYLRSHFEQALQSFYGTIQQIVKDNPVDIAELTQLVDKAKAGTITPEESGQLEKLKLAATRQGRAVGGVYGFFLKYKPWMMLAEIRDKEKFFQPPFGPILVVHGDTVRDVLTRHSEFTVDPYGREMIKSMSTQFNGGHDTFILSTDEDSKYIDDKNLLTTVVNEADGEKITDLIHRGSMRRVGDEVTKARAANSSFIDVVTTVARFVPVTLAHHYLGVPAAQQKGSFELTDDMLKYYGDKVAGPDGVTPLPTAYQRPDGNIVDLPDTALKRDDGVIPDETRIYHWIKAAFQNFFNNIQKDITVQAHGVRACRELLVYILREIDIQREALQRGSSDDSIPDTMLTRLLRLQMGLPFANGASGPPTFDPGRINDLRIAENVLGTIVGAIAGQEEATCRVLDSMIRLKEGEYERGNAGDLSHDQRHGSFDEARELALNVLEGRDVEQNRRDLKSYVLEALRLQPQGEVLLRECVKEGATIANSRPIRAGTLIFAAHGSAMKDITQPDSFILERDQKHYLQHGYGRHKCLGQYVSPVIMVEALIAILALENVRRPEPRPGEPALPLERRFGRLQLDDNNLYAETFTLQYDDNGTTSKYFR